MAAAARLAALLLTLWCCISGGEQSQGVGRIVFLGSGPSTALPDLRCVANGAAHGRCRTCTRARRGPRNKNFRGNVSLLITIPGSAGQPARHIIIDCGKTFRSAVLRFFHKLGVDGVDAIILTHDHADAVLGLDDIRSVQRLDAERQMTPTPVFCDRRTLRHCARAFPYLVHPRRASGIRRFVAQLEWHAIDEAAPFDVCGVEFTPLPVEHGAGYTCMGYAFGPDEHKVVYLSDYTHVPPDVLARLRAWSTDGKRIALLVLDAIDRDNPPRVHASLKQSLQLVRELRPRLARFVGMSHSLEHHATNRELRALGKREGLDIALAHDGLALSAQLTATA